MSQFQQPEPSNRADRRAAKFKHRPGGMIFTMRGMQSKTSGKVKKVSRTNIGFTGEHAPPGVQ